MKFENEWWTRNHVHDHQDKDEQTYENHTQTKYQMQFLQKIQDEKTKGIKKQHMIF
jgi:hypothetical protein